MDFGKNGAETLFDRGCFYTQEEIDGFWENGAETLLDRSIQVNRKQPEQGIKTDRFLKERLGRYRDESVCVT